MKQFGEKSTLFLTTSINKMITVNKLLKHTYYNL